MKIEFVNQRDPILRQPAKLVTPDDFRNRELQEIIVSMYRYVLIRPRSVKGLAANQIGVGLRIAIIRFGLLPTVLINPEIRLWSATNQDLREVCLSLPGRKFLKSRSAEVGLEWEDGYGQRRNSILKGSNAAVAQHEIDHLNGKLLDPYR